MVNIWLIKTWLVVQCAHFEKSWGESQWEGLHPIYIYVYDGNIKKNMFETTNHLLLTKCSQKQSGYFDGTNHRSFSGSLLIEGMVNMAK